MAEQITLNVDCRGIDVARLGHASVLTDPAYSDHVHESMVSCAQSLDVKGVRHRDAGFDPLSRGMQAYLVGAVAAAPGWSVLYSDLESVGSWCQMLRRRPPAARKSAPPGRYVRSVIVDSMPWIRWSSPQQSGDRPPQGAEAVVLAHGLGEMRWFGPGNLTRLDHKCLRGLAKHPTEKPLDQALDIVSWFTEPEDLIYDPNMGSGTFGVACALLGRSYLGCEHWGDSADAAVIAQSRRWYGFAAERLSDAQRNVLSKRDTVRLGRWVTSVHERSELAPPTKAQLSLPLHTAMAQLNKGLVV